MDKNEVYPPWNLTLDNERMSNNIGLNLIGFSWTSFEITVNLLNNFRVLQGYKRGPM